MRVEGYYWIKVKEPNDDLPHWEIDKWYLPRHEDMCHWSLYLDSDILEIDERRIERQPEATKIIESAELPKGMIILKDIGDGFKQAFPNVPPQYISDNPYLCE